MIRWPNGISWATTLLTRATTSWPAPPTCTGCMSATAFPRCSPLTMPARGGSSRVAVCRPRLAPVWAAAAAAAPTSPVGARPGPFAGASTLPYQAPRFDLIKDRDYQPAFDAGMKQQIAEIEAIAGNPAAPSFDNTIAPLERSGRML